MKMVKLGDVAHVTMGQAPPGSSYNSEELGKPLIAGAGDFYDGRARPTKYTSEPKKIANPKDIILSIRASIGDKVWADQELCLGRGVAGIKPGQEMNANFLWHLLDQLQPSLLAKAKGATFLQVNRSDIESLTFPLPPLDEQLRIAAILNSHQQSIRSCQNLCEKLGQIEDSIFDSIFSTENRVNKLSDLIESLQGGKSVVGAEGSNNQYRVLKISATSSGAYNENETKPLPSNFTPIPTSIVKPGDVLISRANTSELVGASALVAETNGYTTLPDKLWRATPKPGIDSLFLHRFLSSPETRREISRSATGSGGSMKNISKSKLLSVPAFIPSESQQDEFRKAISSSSKIRALINKVFAAQEELTESLQSRAFRGEL